MSSSTVSENFAAAYHEDKTQENRDKVVFAAEPVIRSIISRLNLPGDDLARPDELYHIGVYAVLQSLDQFDPSNGVRFITFAYPRIRGEIVDFLRRLDPLPRRRRVKVATARSAADRLAQSQGHKATESQLASVMGVTESEVRVIELDSSRRQVSYLFDNAREEEGLRLVDTLKDEASTVLFDCMEQRDIRRHLDQCAEDLSERDRVVLELYFSEDMTLSEIGALLSISEARVSQLRRAALNNMGQTVELSLRTAA